MFLFLDEHLVFEANSDYFEGIPKLEKVIYRIIPDDMTDLIIVLRPGHQAVLSRKLSKILRVS